MSWWIRASKTCPVDPMLATTLNRERKGKNAAMKHRLNIIHIHFHIWFLVIINRLFQLSTDRSRYYLPAVAVLPCSSFPLASTGTLSILFLDFLTQGTYFYKIYEHKNPFLTVSCPCRSWSRQNLSGCALWLSWPVIHLLHCTVFNNLRYICYTMKT